MNEQAIFTITNYMNDRLFEPQSNWPTYIFEERSYSRWVAQEIIQRLMDRPYESPESVIEDFMLRSDIYATYKDGSRLGRIFAIAANVSDDILHLLSDHEKEKKS